MPSVNSTVTAVKLMLVIICTEMFLSLLLVSVRAVKVQYTYPDGLHV